MPAFSPNLVADINLLERIQRLPTNLATHIRHLSSEERFQRRRRLRIDLISAFEIFTGPLDVDPNLFISVYIPSLVNKEVKGWLGFNKFG